jgi:hypothetical protein
MSALADIALRRLPELWARYGAKLQTANTPFPEERTEVLTANCTA